MQRTRLDTKDPVTWIPITDSARRNQEKSIQIFHSTEDAGRKFHEHWFSERMNNGEIVPRQWLI